MCVYPFRGARIVQGGEKRCEHRRNDVNTVCICFWCTNKNCRFCCSPPVKRRQQGAAGFAGLKYTHQPWSSPREEGLRSCDFCLFPTQCIARYTEGLYEVQGNTKHARAPEPSLAQSLMRLLVAVTVRNSRSSAPFPSTGWSTAQGYFY